MDEQSLLRGNTTTTTTTFGNDTTSPELSISLVRLSRPSITDQPIQTLLLCQDQCAGTLVQPTSFGSIYLGEPLYFALHLNHHPNDQAKHTTNTQPSFKDVSLKVELQTTNNRAHLLDVTVPKIKYLGHYTANLTHDVRELGMHILVVQISYNQGKYLRKFFKFQSLNPFQVKTKTTLIPNNRTILELSIQNLTQTYVQITKSTLVPNTDTYTCTTIDPGPSHSFLVSGRQQQKCLMPNDTHQSLYVFTSTSSTSTTQALGRLELEWAGLAGDGRLQTPPLPVKTSHSSKSADDLSILHVYVPSTARVLQPFRIKLQIVNQTRMTVSISVSFIASSTVRSVQTPLSSPPPSSISRKSSTLLVHSATPPSRKISATGSSNSQPKSSPSVLKSPPPPQQQSPQVTHSLSNKSTVGALTAFRQAVNLSALQQSDDGQVCVQQPLLTTKDFEPVHTTDLTILGAASSIQVGDILAGQSSIVFAVQVVGLVNGIHFLPLLRVTDAHTSVTRTLDPRVCVWVGGDAVLKATIVPPTLTLT